MTAWRRKKGSKADIHKAASEYHKQFAQQVIEQIKKGVAPWQKPWKPGEKVVPVNFNTRDPYRGGNAVYLAAVSAQKGYSDHRWGTYRQIAAAGGYVRRHEKGVRLVYFTNRELKLVRDEDGKPKRDEDGRKIYEMAHLDKPKMNSFVVFNVEQADRLKLPPRHQEQPAWKAHKDAERVIRASEVPIQHVSGDRAYYRPTDDTVVLPEREQFLDADGYYQTALHELGHATGHEDRMNRKVFRDAVRGGFGSPEYAREELRAEMSAMMTGTEVGVGHDPTRGAAYVESWVKALEKDSREIHKAASEAWRMSAYLVNRAREFDRREGEAQQKPEALPVNDDHTLSAGVSQEDGNDHQRAKQWAQILEEAENRLLVGYETRGDALHYYNQERVAVVTRAEEGRGEYALTMSERGKEPGQMGHKATASFDKWQAVATAAQDYVANDRRPVDQNGRDLLPKGVTVTSDHGRVFYTAAVGRVATVTPDRPNEDGRTKVRLAAGRSRDDWEHHLPNQREAHKVAQDWIQNGRIPGRRHPSALAGEKSESTDREAGQSPARRDLPPLPAGLRMTSNGKGWIRYDGGHEPNGRSAEIQTTQGKDGMVYRVHLEGQGAASRRTIGAYQDAHQAARDYVSTGRMPGGAPEMNRHRQIERDAGPSR